MSDDKKSGRKINRVNPEKPETLALVAEAQSGSEPAMLALHEKFSRYAHALRLLFLGSYSDDEVFEDTLGEVTAAIQETVQNYRPERKVLFGTLLYLVCRRRMLHVVAKHRRTREHIQLIEDVGSSGGPLDGSHPQDPTTAVDEFLGHPDASKILRAAVGKLPPDLADVVRRRYLRGQTSARIAADLGCTRAEITARVRVAVLALREALG